MGKSEVASVEVAGRSDVDGGGGEGDYVRVDSERHSNVARCFNGESRKGEPSEIVILRWMVDRKV